MKRIKANTHTHTYIYIKREREGESVRERERERDTKQLYWFLLQSRSSPVSLHFQGIFTIITIDYNCPRTTERLMVLKHTSKRLLNAQSQLKETSK